MAQVWSLILGFRGVCAGTLRAAHGVVSAHPTVGISLTFLVFSAGFGGGGDAFSMGGQSFGFGGGDPFAGMGGFSGPD